MVVCDVSGVESWSVATTLLIT